MRPLAARTRSIPNADDVPPHDAPWRVTAPATGMLWPRWLFLRAIGVIFGSAFYSLLFQVRGLIGPAGIQPADAYLAAIAAALPRTARVWTAPTLFWWSATDGALLVVVSTGLIAAVLLTINVWPRVTAAVCTVLFLSCVTALQTFSSYQSDGMLLQAGVAAVLLAPRGLRPGLGSWSPPSWASVWLVRWEWFSIYFGSGVVKLWSGDPQWRSLTAMDHYYENSPLPSWPGWYAQQLPHPVHAATALLTLLAELALPWVLLLPRRPRIAVAVVLTVFQIGIIATANYAFLNYLVLTLGVFLVDDRAITGLARRVWRTRGTTADREISVAAPQPPGVVRPSGYGRWTGALRAGVLVATIYLSASSFLAGKLPAAMSASSRYVEAFRFANSYGLFAVMTTAEYEIEFQGMRRDSTWVAYPFRYKPQDPFVAPGLYAPYQPRFEWNLWFASLGPWSDSPWVVTTEARLLRGDPQVLALFAANPFGSSPPVAVRTVLWRYWFTDAATRRRTGRWWNRDPLGLFAGTVTRSANGAVQFEPASAPPESAR
jgi:lipase maturation factor 1